MAKLCLKIALLFWAPLAWCDPNWDAAVLSLQQEKTSEAIPLFEKWIEEARARGIRSPEAHHNLALACFKSESWGPAVFHLAESAWLRANPLYSLDTIHKLTLVQRRLMIQDAVPTHAFFYLALLMPSGLLLSVLFIGIWMIAFSPLVRAGGSALRMGGIGILLLVAGAWALRAAVPRFAVVIADADRDLLAGPKPGEKKLTELPQGALVTFSGEARDGYQPLSAPFAGWVREASLKPIFVP